MTGGLNDVRIRAVLIPHEERRIRAMEIVRSRTGWLSGLLVAVVLGGSAPAVTAQTTMMGSTLRYGSGYLDVPSASVLPHLALLGTFSGFWVNTDQSFLVNELGQTTGFGPGVSDFKADGSVTLGLYDRVEVGATFQSFNDADKGGNMVGAFGQLALLRPEAQGIGLAVGARYVSAPEYDGITGRDFQPTRLGIPDDRFHKGLPDGGDLEDEVSTQVSLWSGYRLCPGHGYPLAAGARLYVQCGLGHGPLP
jgi:hypothetical protein